MTDWAAAAAANNAAWCDLVARTHGSQTAFGADAWTSASRTPPLYPDAVTLGRKADGRDVLSRVDASPGCSVKDSFASLDLSEDGFHVLLDGLWIVHEEERGDPVPAGRTGVSWTRVTEPEGLEAWVRASRGDDGPADLFRPELLDEESVAFVGFLEGGAFVWGAVLNRTAAVVGVSNLFTTRASGDPWRGSLAAAAAVFPGSAVVGWESGDALAEAERHGFERAGRLRVWLRAERP